jgi:hypothetical protein
MSSTVFSTGAGMTAGLAILWDVTRSAYILQDSTPDGRFAADVCTWNAVAPAVPTIPTTGPSLNVRRRRKAKDAKE